MNDTENRVRIKSELTPDTKVKMSISFIATMSVLIAVNAFAVGGAYVNFNAKLERLSSQQTAFIEAQNKNDDKFQTQLDAMKIELAADEKILETDENNHRLWAQMVESKLNIKTQ